MKVMLDTNVLVSAFVFDSPTLAAVIDAASTRGNTLQLSTFVIEELRAVVAAKWPERAEKLEGFLRRLSFETVLTPRDPVPRLFDIRDPMDYPVLYSAVVGGADVLVTGDKDFQGLGLEHPAIETPSEFLRFHADGGNLR